MYLILRGKTLLLLKNYIFNKYWLFTPLPHEFQPLPSLFVRRLGLTTEHYGASVSAGQQVTCLSAGSRDAPGSTIVPGPQPTPTPLVTCPGAVTAGERSLTKGLFSFLIGEVDGGQYKGYYGKKATVHGTSPKSYQST